MILVVPSNFSCVNRSLTILTRAGLSVSMTRPLVVGAMVFILAGCGNVVPELADSRSDANNASLYLVRGIVHSIHCEIRRAIIHTLGPSTHKMGKNEQGAFMLNWGAQVALTLTVDEKTTLNPAAVWLPPSAVNSIFTLGASGTLSTDATRIEKMNYFFNVADIRKEPLCDTIEPQSSGSLLIQSDLKLEDWLHAEVLAASSDEITVPLNSGSILKQNVISHEVKFEVVTSAGITPAIKLEHVTLDQIGTLLSGSRDRIHDLLITLGPIDPKTGGLIVTAENAHFASQLSSTLNRQVVP